MRFFHLFILYLYIILHTVDGLKKTRLPVKVGSLSHDLRDLSNIPNGGYIAGFLNHQGRYHIHTWWLMVVSKYKLAYNWN